MADVASPEAEMSESEADKLGGLSLGGLGDSGDSKDKPINNMFGSFPKPTTEQQPAASAFGGATTTSSFGGFGATQGSGFLKPASGSDYLFS